MSIFLEFEQPVVELEGKIKELALLDDPDLDIAEEIDRLSAKRDKQLKNIYSHLTPWQKIQVARHQDRPRLLKLLPYLVEDFTLLSGDRLYAEDHAIIGGLARFDGQAVMVIGQERGADITSRLKHNFGMPRPEGYRKAQRLMRLAEKFNLPILTFVDTPGAYPGIGAEERGQAEAIAKSIQVCLQVQVPIIATVIGEGGSGGAIAIAAADRVLMMEHAVYSVISPEGCASILWRDAKYADTAAEALKITAQDLLAMQIIDEIIPEPMGGAHRKTEEAAANLKQALIKALESVTTGDTLLPNRHARYLAMTRGQA